MSFLEILYRLLITPLQTVFETIYSLAYAVIGNPGLSIIVLSLAMNLLVLPLYRRADAMQEEERNMEAKLHNGVQHIKKTFRGDEQMLLLQTYYRQNNYKPTYVLRGATSLFLEIPFFIAAYRFLSNLPILDGVSFGPIANLGEPDAMLTVAGLSINVLPVIMTVVNFISSYIFTKGYPLKTKLQLYGMAAFFLVFLYDSPSGLVFYWTLNNVFSLVKTIFYKLKNPRKALLWLIAAIGAAFFGAGLFLFFCPVIVFKGKRYLCLFGLLLFLPLLWSIFGKKHKKIVQLKITRPANPRLFFAGAVFLAVLTGALIPSAVISSSPQEFVILGYFANPLWYIVSACCISFGTFVIWLGIFYWLAGEKYRVFFDYAVWVLSGVALVDYMFFGKDLGTLSATLQYESGMAFSAGQQLMNFAVVLLVAILFVLLYVFLRRQTFDVLVIGTLAICGMAAFNMVQIHDSAAEINQDYATQNTENEPLFSLSKTGKNVIVLMLDRAMGEYVPYLMNEKPELKEQFDGFTYYSNVISFGGHTNVGSPALFGGYEYTPIEINRRSEESLMDKQDEALKVMPVLFNSSGYKVTVCDPVYAGYQWVPDLSIYSDYPEISTYITMGMFQDNGVYAYSNAAIVSTNKQNFFRFSMVKCIPLCVQTIFYKNGSYCSFSDNTVVSAVSQEALSSMTAVGLNSSFLSAYNVLTNLPNITQITDDSENTFLMMCNDTTHASSLLQEPEYEPSEYVDNTAFEAENRDRFTVNGRQLAMSESQTEQYATYQCDMAAFIQLGKWFDWMREQGVYDNTRIILVSDHGYSAAQLPELFLDDVSYDTNPDDRYGDAEFYFPLLMVKDFGATGFEKSTAFMTNADVPTLATEDIIDNPTNPFTGKVLDTSEKTAHDQYILATRDFNVSTDCGNTFSPARWYTVHDNIWDKNNWTLVAQDAVLSDYPE